VVQWGRERNLCHIVPEILKVIQLRCSSHDALNARAVALILLSERGRQVEGEIERDRGRGTKRETDERVGWARRQGCRVSYGET
jgi:hypothetical protein